MVKQRQSEPSTTNYKAVTTPLAFGLTVLTLVLVGLLLSLIPNHVDYGYIEQNFVPSSDNFQPERAEKAQYVILTILFPCCYALYQWLLDQFYHPKWKPDTIKSASWALAGIIALSLFIAVRNPYYWSDVISRIIRGPWHALGLLAFTGLAMAGLRFYRDGMAYQRAADLTLLVTPLLLCLFVAWLFVCFDYFVGGAYQYHHFNAYFHPVYRVYSGQTMVVDFEGLYGFYPYFLSFLFHLTGGINMTRFSLVMAALMVIAGLSLVFFLRTHCRNKFVAGLGGVACIFLGGILGMVGNSGAYYLQYFPQRYLFPALCVLYCGLYALARDRNRLWWWRMAGLVLCPCAILWNLDTGLVVLLACAAFTAYHALWDHSWNEPALYKKLGWTLLTLVVQIALAAIALIAITWVRSGQFLSPGDIFFAQTVFFADGFNMLPMTLWHPWLLLALLYAVALVKSIGAMKFLRKDCSPTERDRMSFYFMLPVLGMGVFLYFQGRSHDSVFLSVIWPGAVLATLFLDEYTQKTEEHYRIKKEEATLRRVRQMSMALVVSLCAGLFALSAADPAIMELPRKKQNYGESHLPYLMDVMENFRESNGGPLDLIVSNAAIVYCQWDEPMLIPVSDVDDWFTADQCRNVTDYLSVSERSFIIHQYYLDILLRFDAQRLNQVLSERFVQDWDRDGYLFYRIAE